MLGMYATIVGKTWRQQIGIIVLSLALSALAAAPLEIQKTVINHLVAGGEPEVLLWLALGYLAVSALSAGLKFAVEYLSAALGERTIRNIRTRIYEAMAEGGEGRPGRGTAVTMIATEAEQIGSFVGEAIANPLVRAGTLATVIAYIASQSAVLGLITAAVVLPQGLLTLLTQGALNARVRQRTGLLREASDRISASELDGPDPGITERFDGIFEARTGIFRIKLSTKLAMNVMTGMGLTAILFLGGMAVIEGRIDVGTIAVAITALTRTVQPWRELVMFYRKASMMRVRYEMLRESFPEARAHA